MGWILEVKPQILSLPLIRGGHANLRVYISICDGGWLMTLISPVYHSLQWPGELRGMIHQTLSVAGQGQ